MEGHLKIETRVEDGIITQAQVAGLLFRGLEKALIGYDARVAQQVTQRVCGVCPYSHAEAAALALEDAMGIRPNTNGQLLRNLITGAYLVHDSLLHFYQLSALDFIDIEAVLAYKGTDPVLGTVRQWVREELGSSRIFPGAPFLPRYRNDDQMQGDADSLLLVRNYFSNFTLLAELQKMVAIFGGKAPHPVAIEAGGVTTRPTLGMLAQYRTLLRRAEAFVLGPYREDIFSVCRAFPHYFQEGRGYGNLLSFPFMPEADGDNHLFTGGALLNGEHQPLDLGAISEDHTYAFYRQESGAALPPLGTKRLTPLNWQEFQREEQQKGGKYSWSRAPRYHGEVMEVGAAARIVNSYHQGGNQVLRELVGHTNRELGITLADYNSVMGRHLSRYLSAALIIGRLKEQVEMVEDGVLGFEEREVPRNARGVGITEASRGALGHWLETDEAGLIKNYELVVPSTWNFGPKDAEGKPGAVEKMLLGTRISNPEQPLEAARIARSADPCIACSVH
ncbi:nickel-dependent hydrogenase large subunit [Desulfurivibrio dismutans]|uniref:nickel-dependent hydrogenase large subunit n=1 Tax=Desulfurivibrio dismutans TaxID=1398908 RepID=UPI0023DA4101|nr:nickel-dependent hydrogenase large subunit [Desulfurivibrio alkaliphilus]MDF1614937.1 nickel-dependent hydrogenase large subunit [Desulfurivibrio alkaliphilus]